MKLFHNPWEKWVIIICVTVLLVLGISSAKAAVTIGSVADKMGQTWNERDGQI